MRLIFGAMRDKAIAEIAGVLFPVAQQVIVTAPKQARAETSQDIPYEGLTAGIPLA